MVHGGYVFVATKTKTQNPHRSNIEIFDGQSIEEALVIWTAHLALDQTAYGYKSLNSIYVFDNRHYWWIFLMENTHTILILSFPTRSTMFKPTSFDD